VPTNCMERQLLLGHSFRNEKVFARIAAQHRGRRVLQFVLSQFGEKGGRQQAGGLLLSNDTRPVLPSRQRRMLVRVMLLVGTTMSGMFCAGSVGAQERPRNNEYAVWFVKQFAPGYAFSEETNGRLYQIEGRYTRVVFARRLIAVRYVAELVPWTVVGDPHTPNGRLAYAHGAGGSPIGAQVNFLHYRHVQPFVTSGGGFLYFDRRMFGTAQQFNFTAQFGGGLQLLSPGRRTALDVGYKYHHISNANLDRTNPGMASHLFFVGVSFYR
jgi:hypothetical protein